MSFGKMIELLQMVLEKYKKQKKLAFTQKS